MRKVFLFASLPMILALAVMVTGCGTQQPGAGQGEPAADHHEGHDHEGHDHEGHDHGDQEDGASARPETGEYQEALAELAPADRELAEKQKVCPVSGQPLGFVGSGGQYLGLALGNWLLSAITCGFYALLGCATVRELRWVGENTLVPSAPVMASAPPFYDRPFQVNVTVTQ